MIWDVEMQLYKRKGGQRADRVAAQGEVALDVAHAVVPSVARLLYHSVGIPLEVGDESLLTEGCSCFDGILPEPGGSQQAGPGLDNGGVRTAG